LGPSQAVSAEGGPPKLALWNHTSSGVILMVPGMRIMRLRTSVLALLAIFLTPLMAFAQEHGEEAGGGGLFSLSAGLMIWTVVIFTGLLLVLWRFAWGPILAAVEAREKGIQDSLDEAKSRQEEAEKLLEEHKAQLADARRQAGEILAEGREAGDRLKKELEGKAREESEAILIRARAEIEREKDAALDTLRKESVDLALAAASKLLHTKLDGELDRKLVMEYVDGISAKGSGAEA
jgi:F-type H+-transporting ATPase subunit b